jgi:hypothetical protein
MSAHWYGLTDEEGRRRRPTRKKCTNWSEKVCEGSEVILNVKTYQSIALSTGRVVRIVASDIYGKLKLCSLVKAVVGLDEHKEVHQVVGIGEIDSDARGGFQVHFTDICERMENGEN